MLKRFKRLGLDGSGGVITLSLLEGETRLVGSLRWFSYRLFNNQNR